MNKQINEQMKKQGKEGWRKLKWKKDDGRRWKRLREWGGMKGEGWRESKAEMDLWLINNNGR